MEEVLTTIKERISNTTNSKLYQLCQIINTEVLRRYKTGQLKDHFAEGDQLVFTDDDGCVLFGEIASKDEFHSLDPDQIFIKEVDPKTKQNFVVEDDTGNFLVAVAPMMNEAQIFKYVLEESSTEEGPANV